jgi:hypothetical protein
MRRLPQEAALLPSSDILSQQNQRTVRDANYLQMTQPAPMLSSAQPKDRGRIKSAIAALIVTVLLWISVTSL